MPEISGCRGEKPAAGEEKSPGEVLKVGFVEVLPRRANISIDRGAVPTRAQSGEFTALYPFRLNRVCSSASPLMLNTSSCSRLKRLPTTCTIQAGLLTQL